MIGARTWLACAGIGLASLGADSAELALTPEKTARLVLEGNRELRAARGIVAEAQARGRTTGRLANPEIQAELAGGAEFEGRAEVGIAQRFPLTARLRLEREISAVEVEMAALEVAEKERQLVAAARTAFVEMAAAREAVDLAGRHLEASASATKALAGGVREGLASRLDAAAGALAGTELESRRASLRADEAALAGEFATLLGLPLETGFSLVGGLRLPRAVPADRPSAPRPDLRLAELAVRAGEADVRLAKASRWEDVAVGLFAEVERTRDEPEGIENEALLGIRVSLPLPLWQNGAGRIAEKQSLRARRALQLEAARLAVRNESLAAHRALAARHEAARRLEADTLPAARRFLAETEAAHGRGELSPPELFRARERVLELETAALDARKNFHLALVRWLAAVGDVLPRP